MSNTSNTLEILKPKPCPHRLIRVGGDADGAYLIPSDLQGISACFSPGCANHKPFEDELTNRFDIRCHLMDFSSDAESFSTPLVPGKQTFQKKWLDIDGGPNNVKLSEWIAPLEPTGDLLLQMDIEGAEYRNLANCPLSLLKRFRIIVLEMHDLQIQYNAALFVETIAPVIQLLGDHFVSVHAHANNAGGREWCPETGLDVPHVLEITFLRKDRFELASELTTHPPMIPHPLDIDRNCRNRPPLFLSETWLPQHQRSLESQERANSIYTANSGICINELYRQLETADRRIRSLERRLQELNWLAWLEKSAKSIKSLFRKQDQI
jgi:hypothetical protein